MSNSPSIFPEPPRCFRRFLFSGTVVDVNLQDGFAVAGADMSGCPANTPSARLRVLNTQATVQQLVLIGEDDVSFILDCEPGVIDVGGVATAVGKVTVFEGGVKNIVAAGSGTIESVLASWWTGSRSPRRNPAP